MKKQEDIVAYDFQGWPVYKMTLREILLSLGCKLNDKTNTLEINNDSKVLDVYPIRLQDDGMGYGVGKEYITEVDVALWDKDEYTVHIFTEQESQSEQQHTEKH